MVRDPGEILVLVGSIYEAGADSARWVVFLRRLCEALRSDSSSLLIHDLHSRNATLSAHVGKTPAVSRGAQPRHHALGRVIVRAQGVTSVLTCLRSGRLRAYGKAERRLLDELLPHLARAVELHRKLCHAELQSELGIRALDYLAHGVVLVDDDGQIVLMNQLAKSIISQSDGLSVTDNTLIAGSREADRELKRLLREAGSNHTEFRFSGGGAMLAKRPSGRRPYSILVSPLKAHPFFVDRHSSAVAIFLSDPESEIEAPEQMLLRLYDLTPAESRLALVLLQGVNLSEAARRIGITRNTAHTQLQSIYAKTRVRRQSELMALLLRGISTIRQLPADSDGVLS